MEQALKTMINNMPEKTGKSLEQWFDVLAKQNFTKHSLAVNYLKTQYNVGHGFASTIVSLANEKNAPVVDLVASQYQGKESIYPIYKALLSIVESFGSDIIITPKKASVSLIRKHQFALIKPATKTRIDLGLKLKGVAVQGVLEDSGPFGTMCTHRIQLKSIKDIDQAVSDWLTQAYQMSV